MSSSANQHQKKYFQADYGFEAEVRCSRFVESRTKD